jgi:hypothetical protein
MSGGQAETEAALVPEVARLKQAIHQRLPKQASKEPQGSVGKRGGKAKGRRATTFGISLMPEMREKAPGSAICSPTEDMRQLSLARESIRIKAGRREGKPVGVGPSAVLVG